MEITYTILLSAFLIALLMGAAANKTNFCTMGAISDWVNMNNGGRLGAWFFAIAIAVIGLTLLESFALINTNEAIPPYRTPQFSWLRYVLGGMFFGIGMTLASGCGNKTLVNIGGGSLKSLMVLMMIGLTSYSMTKTSFYELTFYPLISATTVDLTTLGIPHQSLHHLIGADNDCTSRWVIGLTLGLILLLMALRFKHFRTHWKNPLGGAAVGLAVVAGWWISGGPLGQEWVSTVEWMDVRPAAVGVQSYTFINPMGDAVAWLNSPAQLQLVTFGIVALFGIISGSFIAAVLSKKFQLTWFKDKTDFIKHVIGAILMGIGGILAMGCTIGQAITGISTLSIGSIMVFASIVFGATLTMKIQYYQMFYEDEDDSGFGAILLSVLADMNCLPNRMRKLDQP